MKSYYNTNKLDGESLFTASRKAQGQEEIILKFFQNNPFKKFTPPEVHRQTGLEQNGSPLTSIRRAITNLTISGDLNKTSIQVEGPYKSPTHKWELNINKHKQEYQPTQLSIFE